MYIDDFSSPVTYDGVAGSLHDGLVARTQCDAAIPTAHESDALVATLLAMDESARVDPLRPEDDVFPSRKPLSGWQFAY